MSASPLRLPEVPPYYQLPEDLEAQLAAALAQQAAVTAALEARRTPDPSFATVVAEARLEVSLAAAKLAVIYAVCQIQDWADEL